MQFPKKLYKFPTLTTNKPTPERTISQKQAIKRLIGLREVYKVFYETEFQALQGGNIESQEWQQKHNTAFQAMQIVSSANAVIWQLKEVDEPIPDYLWVQFRYIFRRDFLAN